MKRYGAITLCAALLCVWLLSMCRLAVAQEAEDTHAETAQLLILSNFNRDYSQNDKNQQFIQMLKSAMRMLPVDGTSRVVLFPNKADSPETAYFDTEMAVDAFEHYMTMEDPSVRLDQIRRDYAGKANRNIVVAIETSRLKVGTLEERWGKLKELPDYGFDVFMFSLGASNGNMKSTFAEWLYNDDTGKSVSANEMYSISDHFHFACIENYNNLPAVIEPFMNAVYGNAFEVLQPDEQGIYSLYSIEALLLDNTLILQGNIQENLRLSMTDSNGDAVDFAVLYQGKDIALVRPKQKVVSISIKSDAELTSLRSGTRYKDLSATQLLFKNLDGQTVFKRNEAARFYASVSDVDQAAFGQSLLLRQIPFELIDIETGEVLQVMEYDPEYGVFRADCVFTGSSDDRQLGARVVLGNQLTLISEPFHVQVTNTAPVINVESAPMYWINDPWDTSDSAIISIPLSAADAENDNLTFRITTPQDGIIGGVGRLRLNNEQNTIEVLLDTTHPTETGKANDLCVSCSDGEAQSSCDFTLLLYDLQRELQAIQSSASLTLEPSSDVFKKSKFNAAAFVNYPSNMPDHLNHGLIERIGSSYNCKLVIVDSNGESLEQEMMLGEGWHCTVQLDDADAYQVKAVFYPDRDAPAIESQPQTLQVLGRVPKLITDNPLASLTGLMEQPEGSDEELWEMRLIPNDLFTDDDGDEISISVEVERKSDKPSETPVKMTGQAAGSQEAIFTFTVSGNYRFVITPSDIDGTGEPYECVIHVDSAKELLIRKVLIWLAIAASAVLLMWLIIYCIKPGFSDKVIDVEVKSSNWASGAKVYPGVWRKKKQPLSMLLTCAACPPDEKLYVGVEGCQIKPTRHGIVLLKTNNLSGLGKSVSLNENESVTIPVGSYSIALMVSSLKEYKKNNQGERVPS